jgi:small subunit ribosomal protein S17
MESLDKTTEHKANASQIMVGTVVSTKMAKTVVVSVRTHKRHEKYHKSYSVTKRYKAAAEDGAYEVGDKVEIVAVKPISKDKRFKVLKRV